MALGGLDLMQEGRGVFDYLLGYSDRMRRIGKLPHGFEEVVLSIERVLDDIDDELIGEAATRKLRFWLEVVEQSKTPEAAALGLDSSLRGMLIALVSWTGEASPVLGAIKQLEPDPPRGWSPDSVTGLVLDAYKKLLTTGEGTYWSPELTESLRSLLEEQGTEGFLVRFKKIEAMIAEVGVKHGDEGEHLKKIGELGLGSQNYSTQDDRQQSVARLMRIIRKGPKARGKQFVSDARSTWSIEITFPGAETSASELGYLLWSLSTALEAVDGVAALVEHLGKGSLIVRIKVFIKNLWSRDEVQEILHKARNAVVKQVLDKPVEEVEKLKASREKLLEETKAIQKQIEAMPNKETSDKAEKLRLRGVELQNKKDECTIKSMELDNAIKRLNVVERASELVARGLLSVDRVKIDINDHHYLTVEEGQALEGDPIEEIVDGETILRDDSVGLDSRDEA